MYGDGDSAKSFFAQAVAVAVQTGIALPGGLKPTRAVLAAYLDYETSHDALEQRCGLVARGYGIATPPVLYKRMIRPLVDEAPRLAVEFAQRGVGLVVVDSKMFALADSGDGGGIQQPMTAFYNAARLFAPAASLVINHVTGADARSTGATRPFGGVFAYNGPRLVIEMKRDREIADAAAVVFTYTKANNLARRPDPFGLKFTPDGDAIRIMSFDLAEATPQAVAGARLVYRLRLALSRGGRTVEALAKELGATEDTVRRTLQRHHAKGTFVQIPDTKPLQWGLGEMR